MTDFTPPPAVLDHAEAARWPTRAAAHALGIGLVLAVLAALPASPSDLDRHQLPKETAVHLATWMAVVLARPFPAIGLRRAASWACILLIAVSSLSGVLAVNPWLAFRATALSLTGIAALVTARHLGSAGLGETLLRWSAAAVAIGTTTGLAQAYGLDSPFFASTRAPGGTFGNRNFMAHFAVLGLPLALRLTLRANRFKLIPGLLLTIMLATAIVLSRSRAAWLGSGAVIAITALASWRARRTAALPFTSGRMLLWGSAALLGVIAAVALPNVLEWKARSPYAETLVDIANHREGSGRGRMVQYRNTLRLAAAHPLLGVGPGNWPIRYSDVAPPSDPSWAFGDPVPLNPWPSSDWMALVSERGVVALAAILLLAAAMGWRAWRALPLGGMRAVDGALLLGFLAAIAVMGLFDAVLLLPAPLLLTAMMVGALLQQVDGNTIAHDGTPRERSLLGTIATVALAVITLRSATQSMAYLVAGNGHDMRRLTWAARIDPGSYPIRIALAERGLCASVRDDAAMALRLAPNWPAPRAAARRCGVR